MASGSKRPRDRPTQELKVKFLINIPLKVDSEVEAQNRCRYLLDALKYEGFEEKYMNGEKCEEKNFLDDVAVIFGMNGQHSSTLKQILDKLKTYKYDCGIKYSIITYTWGSGGDIAQKETQPPYQDIREYIKNHSATKKLVEDLKRNDPKSLVYFSFVDSDTFSFNCIYSAYLQIVKNELDQDSIPPTVMSTGYEFHRGSEHHVASWLDRMVRVATAEIFPLGMYYPEPNFCVLVRDGCNTIEESFIDQRRKNMESPVLISRVKNRANFKAVFPDNKPIIIVVPERFKLRDRGLQTGQSNLDKRMWAICSYVNGALSNKETIRGITGKNRKFLIDLLKCKDKNEFDKLSVKNPYNIQGQEATILIEAARSVKEYMEFVDEFEAKLQE